MVIISWVVVGWVLPIVSDDPVPVLVGIGMTAAFFVYWFTRFAIGCFRFLGFDSPRMTYYIMKAKWEENNRIKNFEESQMLQRLEELRSAVFSVDVNQKESS